MAYVAILFLLVIMTTLGLAFLLKAGTETSVAMTRGTNMQAEYLAEAAASHAMWRLLNDPGFPADETVYYMHELGTNRYGYKVRAPGAATFATIATVGATGDNVVQQSYVPYVIPSNVITAYGRTSDSIPDYRRMVGTSFSSPVDTVSSRVPEIAWVELEGCPIRKEIVIGTIDSQDDIILEVWDGTSWGGMHEFAFNVDKNHKCFDIAYESQSGDALVVGRYDATTTVYFNSWDGNAWAHVTPQTAFTLDSGQLNVVTMASCPGNDDILIVCVSSQSDMKLFLWDGAAFTDLGALETNTATTNHGVATIAYERQSGDALVFWAATGTVHYRIWDGATLGPESTVSGIADDTYVIRVASDPASDHIILGALDKFCDLQVAVWDGDAWIDAREVDASVANSSFQAFDVAWEAAGEDAMVAWGPWGPTNVRALTWRKGTLLADQAIIEGPDVTAQSWLVRLFPVSNSEKLVLLCESNSNALRYTMWNGDGFKGDPGILLEASVSAQNEVAFDIAEALVPIAGGTGTGSGGGGNQAPTVDAGTDETITLPTDTVNLDGTVTDDGLPNPPGSFTTTWTMTSGPGMVTFGDAAAIDTTAQFSEAGTYVLRLTADDSELNAYDEVTTTVQAGGSAGNLLFVSAGYMVMEMGSGEMIAVPTATEQPRIDLIASWGYTVEVINQAEVQADFDTAAAGNDVAYISEEITTEAVGDKVRNMTIGIVNEEYLISDELGLSDGYGTGFYSSTDILDNTHYITSPFGTGALSLFDPAYDIYTGAAWNLAPDLQVLGECSSISALVALEAGGALHDGGVAAGRRVQVPWGDDFSALNADGQTVMRRAIEWAADRPTELLLVVGNSGTLASRDSGRKTLFESWGYVVTLIDDGETQANFDVAAAAADVVYVSGTVGGGTLLDKLTGSPAPIVNEFPGKLDNFGFSSSTSGSVTAASFSQSDPLHYITSPFGGSAVTVFTESLTMSVPSGTVAPGLSYLAEVSGTVALSALDAGAERYDGNPAPARRVHLPFSAAETTQLTADGQSIMRRSIEWAALPQKNGAPTVDAGSDKALTFPLVETALDGTVKDDGLPDPPAAVTTTWSQVSGPAGIDFDDAASVDTTARFPGVGTYVLRLTADDSELNAFDDVTITIVTMLDVFVNDIAMGFRKQGQNYYGQATIWIKDEGGADVEGALVGGDWSGAVSGTSAASTGADGKVMLESPAKKSGGTFTFTVTSVVKSGYNYNAALNVETSDSITAP